MALRTFTDSSGAAWDAWDVRPSARSAPYLPQDARETGWLAFRSGSTVRRLRPIPERWELAEEAELERYLLLASPVPARV